MADAALFKDLKAAIDEESYSKVSSICDKILTADPKDKEGVQCKVVSLIHLGKHQDAMDLMEQNKAIGDSMAYEKAYCFYRLGKFDNARSIIESFFQQNTNKVEPRLLELAAQVHYRLHNYEDCINKYTELIKTSDKNHTELRVNLCAAIAACGNEKLAIALVEKNPDVVKESFEFVYNSACASISVANHSRAKKQLELAEELCNAIMKDDGYTEQEIFNELAPVRVQQAYITQLEGKSTESENMLKEILQKNPTDGTVVAICENNLVSLNKNHKLFHAEKKLQQATAPLQRTKMTQEQQQIVCYNYLLCLVKMNKHAECRKMLSELRPQFKEDPSLLALVEASLLMKEKKFDAGIKVLKENSNSSACVFTLAQICLEKGESDTVVDTLMSLQKDQLYKLSVLASVIFIMEKSNKIDAAVTLFDEALEFWEHNDSEAFANLLSNAAAFCRRHDNMKKAATYYSKLMKVKGNVEDVSDLTSLVIELAKVDTDLAQKYFAKLQPVAVPSDLNADQLEAVPAPKAIRAIASSAEISTSSEAAKPSDAPAKKKKKKRKTKLPKNYDPNVVPDPDRWKPRRERASYRPKRGKAQVNRSSQGVAQTAQEEAKQNAANKQSANNQAKQQKQQKAPTRLAKKKSKRGKRRR